MAGQQKRLVQQLQAQRAKRDLVAKMASKSPNEIASELRIASDGFLASMEWRTLRAKVLARYGWKCMCCGATPSRRSQVNVDHIKPRKLFPELSLDEDNLQVLCCNCNKRKGNRHSTDYRPTAVAAP